MKHLLFPAACLVLFVFATTCRAAGTGTVQLTGLLPGSRIIVDGSPVLAPGGVMHVPTGEHLMQIEAYKPPPAAPPHDDPRAVQPTGVLVFRTCIVVGAGTVETVRVRPVPVYTTNAAYAYPGDPVPPSGPMGPGGPPGPDANLQVTLTTADERQLVMQGLQNLLFRITMLCDDIRLARRQRKALMTPPALLWYSPTGDEVKVVITEGPLGQTGSAGPAGNSGDLARLEDEQGRPLLTRASADLKLPELQQELEQLLLRAQHLPVPPLLLGRLQSIPIYTFSLRAQLNAEFARLAGREMRGIMANDGTINDSLPQGPTGASGPPGPDGELPPDVARRPVVLDATTVHQLVDSLRQDPQINTQVKELQAYVDRMKQTLADTEAQAARDPQCAPELKAGF